jgi:glycosyltransferase involved in cell wall biosynthesis
VDNNSTDDTVAIAKEYKFVRVMTEKRQGVLYARAKGFDAAKGDIIARIDADTIVPEDWIETIIEIFTDSDVAATSGRMEYYDIAMQKTVNRVELSFRRWLARRFAPTNSVFLQAANMAIRKSAWKEIRHELCERNDIHEDFCIALHLQQHGHIVTFDERLVADISLRCVNKSFKQFLAYILANPYTYREHNARGVKHMYLVIACVLLAYMPVRFIFRGYNTETERFHLLKALRPAKEHINPFTLQD